MRTRLTWKTTRLTRSRRGTADPARAGPPRVAHLAGARKDGIPDRHGEPGGHRERDAGRGAVPGLR